MRGALLQLLPLLVLSPALIEDVGGFSSECQVRVMLLRNAVRGGTAAQRREVDAIARTVKVFRSICEDDRHQFWADWVPRMLKSGEDNFKDMLQCSLADLLGVAEVGVDAEGRRLTVELSAPGPSSSRELDDAPQEETGEREEERGGDFDVNAGRGDEGGVGEGEEEAGPDQDAEQHLGQAALQVEPERARRDGAVELFKLLKSNLPKKGKPNKGFGKRC